MNLHIFRIISRAHTLTNGSMTKSKRSYRYIQGSIDLNADWHKHIWDHMINDFAQTFQDIMSKEQADAELNTLKMEKGELDEYTSRFRHLAHMAMYQETDCKLCKDYFRGLPVSLQGTDGANGSIPGA